ncbi:MAG: iron permease FTR1 [Rhizobiales bacterium PAR1]|nr:MAG: iron permease FTR1 [Rhizobiales bacterium PAR1]
MPMLSLALQSGSILLREGLEALLVISALAAFLHRSHAGGGIRALYAGAGAAILASLGAALVFELYFSGAHDDRLEAVTMLVAAILMFYMSGWLFLKQDPRAWQADLRQAADRALASGTRVSLGLIAFLAVFREGAETVLFLHSLAKTSGGWNLGLVIGLVAAAAALVVIFVAIQAFAMRLPLRPVFLITSALLFIMALKFVGGAIQEMQEMQILDVTALDVPGWYIDIVGNATREALLIQIAISVIAIGGTAIAWFRRRPPEALSPAAAE